MTTQTKEIISATAVISAVVLLLGVMFLHALDKQYAIDQLYGWRSDGHGHAYRNIDEINHGG